MLHLSSLKREASQLKRKAKRTMHRLSTPIRPDEMRFALNRLMRSGQDILLVHCSLSSCGRFTAGAEDVIRGIGEFCSTLALPTHTYCYPNSADEAGPVFDPLTMPSQNGLLTEIFRNQSGSIRSVHATHSLAASGSLAEQICSKHYQCETPCGRGTPYSRLIEQRAAVLLFGVSFHSYTLFHTAEDASGSRFAYEEGTIDRLRVLDEEGKERECQSRRQTRNPRRFAQTGPLLEKFGLAHRVTLGKGELLFVPDCSRAQEFLVERLKKVPDFLYESCTSTLQ